MKQFNACSFHTPFFTFIGLNSRHNNYDHMLHAPSKNINVKSRLTILLHHDSLGYRLDRLVDVLVFATLFKIFPTYDSYHVL